MHIKDILNRLRQAGLTLNTAKCHVATKSIKLFGFQIDQGKVTVDDDKVEIIKNYPRPTTKKKLRQFLGLTNYVRAHIRGYSEIACPLTELLANSKPDRLIWTDKQEGAFNTLRTALISKPVLRPADPAKPMIIYADASRSSLSFILMQDEDENTQNRYVVAYGSRKLLPREQKLPIVELELLAIVEALKKFHHWVYGREINVYTDHRPLAYLNSLSKHSPKLAKWNLMLQNYHIKTHYVPGKEQIADCLTRLHQ